LAEAQYKFGIYNENGIGVERNEEIAANLYRKAAEQNLAEAQYKLGLCFLHGKGVKQDNKKSVYWFRKAAEQGLADAQYELGICYQNGVGTEKNREIAIDWLSKAAMQGQPNANVSGFIKSNSTLNSEFVSKFKVELFLTAMKYKFPLLVVVTCLFVLFGVTAINKSTTYKNIEISKIPNHLSCSPTLSSWEDGKFIFTKLDGMMTLLGKVNGADVIINFDTKINGASLELWPKSILYVATDRLVASNEGFMAISEVIHTGSNVGVDKYDSYKINLSMNSKTRELNCLGYFESVTDTETFNNKIEYKDSAQTLAETYRSNRLTGPVCDTYQKQIDFLANNRGAPENVRLMQVESILERADKNRCIRY
jgi:hypothetical protein